MRLSERGRAVAAAAATLALAGTAVGYLQYARDREAGNLSSAASAPSSASPGRSAGAAGTGSGKPARLDAAGSLVFLDSTPGSHYGSLSVLPMDDPAAPPTPVPLSCLRTYAVPGKVLCLRDTGNPLKQYEAVLLDSRLKPIRSIPLAGLPSRARLSRDGRIASWTVFVRGDSYLSVGFSTRTSVLDADTGELIANLESFSIVRDGKPYRSADVNFWGVTVAKDDNTFYATMATRGVTYLVRGDLKARTVRTVATNVECPSLSPDNTRIAFKRRAPQGADGRVPWRLQVLDLATMQQTSLSETRSVDDQAAWLDDRTIAYALPRAGIASYDLWTVKADGSGSPQLLLEHASSPAALG